MVMADAQDILFPTLNFIVELGEVQSDGRGAVDGDDFSTAFTQKFALGPDGLQPIINTLDRLFLMLLSKRHELGVEEFDGHVNTLNAFSAPLLALILHFRTSVPREHYDPASFAELRKEIRLSGQKFPVSPIIIINYH